MHTIFVPVDCEENLFRSIAKAHLGQDGQAAMSAFYPRPKMASTDGVPEGISVARDLGDTKTPCIEHLRKIFPKHVAAVCIPAKKCIEIPVLLEPDPSPSLHVSIFPHPDKRLEEAVIAIGIHRAISKIIKY